MSAYLCDKHHIIYMVKALAHHGDTIYGWRRRNGESINRYSSYNDLVDVCNMLWDENKKSLRARYEDADECWDLEQTITRQDYTNTKWQGYPLASVAKAVYCYEYQSCEHGDEWRKSEAYDFCLRLRNLCLESMPGYEEAEWGAPKPFVRVA